jgi:RNA-directed DNA polymerase
MTNVFDFTIPTTLEELAKFVGVDSKFLEIAICNIQKHLMVNSHTIKKRSKFRENEVRIVWEANQLLAEAHKAFARRFDIFARSRDPRFPNQFSYGYVKGRSTIDNASKHCGAPLILHADIQKFFPSISDKRLEKSFQKLGINKEISKILSKFLTIDNGLPLGFHASPMLANIVCLDLDDKLSKLAKSYNCNYTRYADDITFSGKSLLPKKEEIKEILKEEEFILSERKFRITKPGQSHYVTGLSVTDKLFPRAPRDMKKLLRQELYYCKKFGIEEHLCSISAEARYIDDYGINEIVRHGVNRLDGMVRYVANIEKKSWPNLRSEWHELLKRDNLSPSYKTIKRSINNIIMYIDETEINDRNMLALCIAGMDIEDDISNSNATRIELKRYLTDPISGGNKENIKRNGIHYCDANEDLRKTYVHTMAVMPFKGYVAFCKLDCKEKYEDRYLFLLKSLIINRLKACDGANIKMIFEENSKIKTSKIIQVVEDSYNSLKTNSDRRPILCPEVLFGRKLEYLCFSIPDFLLGVFRRYWSPNKNEIKEKSDRIQLHFEGLRDKYKIILDADKNIIYSRKRPISPLE